ncbi:MAG: TSCPD domain-containing protein [Candidatus Heimdallarchaeota archaeon]|nr:TSCPD domain-containing protein [Candidatus Heimdallarchaeota archaeon]MBY8994877.1 TSCPD domain-containing protein [Candidatus Heimdallarchaeota archaeon]
MYTYFPEEGTDTCKVSFDFEFVEEEDKIIIKQLTIDGEKGCIGHNKSISLLIRNRAIQDLPLEELTEAGCKKASSCSQQLSKALELLVEQRKK